LNLPFPLHSLTTGQTLHLRISIISLLQGKGSRMQKKDLKKSPEVIFNLLVPAASLERKWVSEKRQW